MEAGSGRKFDLHAHSHYSKGTKIPCEALASPRDIVAAAKEKGLAGFALTDHDDIQGWKEAANEAKKQGIVFIPGEEINTQRGHLVALGISEFIEPKLGLEETIDMIHQQGGIAMAVHPFDIKGSGVGEDMIKADVAEAFNSMNMDRFSNMIAEKKARALEMPMAANTDAHTAEMLGTASTTIDADNMDSAFKRMIKGRTELNKGYVPANVLVEWARERMATSYDDIMRYIKGNYRQPKAWVSEALLHKFIFTSRKRWYDALARFGISCSVVYGGLKGFSRL